MKILVTGGAGFIGSHTCVELMKSGYDIVIADNFCNAKRDTVGRIEELGGKPLRLYEADMLDLEALREIFAENDICAAIHFAALKAVGESVRQPVRYYHNNITGALNLITAMNEKGCKKIIFSSSATVYGDPATVPIKETFPLSAASPYAQTKLVTENLLRDLCVSDPEWTCILLRYFNPVGAHESGLIGEDPNGIPNNLMPLVVMAAQGKRKLKVFGNDYPTRDGTCIRDYIHVVDLAQGHVAALNYLKKCAPGAEAINLGSGSGSSVLEILTAFEKAVGVKLPWEMGERRPGDVPQLYADPSKAKELLGWETKLTLEDMCLSSWNFANRQG